MLKDVREFMGLLLMCLRREQGACQLRILRWNPQKTAGNLWFARWCGTSGLCNLRRITYAICKDFPLQNANRGSPVGQSIRIFGFGMLPAEHSAREAMASSANRERARRVRKMDMPINRLCLPFPAATARAFGCNLESTAFA
jgi:hypothetical protein